MHIHDLILCDVGAAVVEPNNVIFTIQVNDVTDAKPVLNGKPFYLAAIDNAKFGTTVFSINVSSVAKRIAIHFVGLVGPITQ